MRCDWKTLGVLTLLISAACSVPAGEKERGPEGAGHDGEDAEVPIDGDSSDDGPESSSDDDSDDPEDPSDPEEEGAEPVEGDHARLVSDSLPGAMTCSEEGIAQVTMQNAGTTVWSRNRGYKLGMVDDEDPFYGPDTRVWLPDGTEVLPGDSWTFTIELAAPGAAGSYLTDWQMVREGVSWFGEQVAAEVNVVCDDSSDDSSDEPGDEPGSVWTEEACARNGSEICDDELFSVEPGRVYGLSCVGPEGGIGFISSNTGPAMSDGVERCQGWEERGEDAWVSLDYVESFVCSSLRIVEVDLSPWSGGDLWFGSHDHPDGGGEMTNICLVSRPE